MRFLADESCDFGIVRALRAAGHDVLAVAEVTPRALDPAVIDLAVRESRVLLTEDKDFGQLVFASGSASSGVILLRYPPLARARIVQAVVKLVEEKGEKLGVSFVVVQPGRIRIGPGPGTAPGNP